MSRITITWDERIPMRDGIRLNATVYRPRTTSPSACLLTITPYVADRYHERGRYFAAHGLPCVIVDSRGRGNSDGVFRPYLQEAQDGHDCVEWLARQPYCNGSVGMWGGSYAGYAQWVTAKERPKNLRAIIPTASPWLGIDFPMRNNIAYPYLMQWIALTRGRAAGERVFADRELWASLFHAWMVSGESFQSLDSAVGLPSGLFQEWVAHAQLGAYWDSYNPSESEYRRIDIPVLTITGIYDDDQVGALEHYRRHVNTSSPGKGVHYLVIGPWDHFRTGTPAADFAGLKFGPASVIDLPKLHCDWYAWTMGQGEKPQFLKRRVAYYVTGTEHWRYADSLERVTQRYERYFLDSGDNSSPGFGRLQDGVGGGVSDQYCYDPRVTPSPESEAERIAHPEFVTDHTLIAALGERKVTYQSQVFERDTEIAGFFRLEAWISIDTPDTDFYVTIYEILPDRTGIRLSTDAMRARYRESLRRPEMLLDADPMLYTFERSLLLPARFSRDPACAW